MGARQKLNQFNVLGSLVVAMLFGAAANSSLVFFAVTAGLIGMIHYVGDIRSQSRRK